MMKSSTLLNSATAALIVVDLQEAFRSVIPDFALIASRVSIAVRGFQTLGAPVIVTEQYPKGLGRTAEEVLLSLPDDQTFITKTSFSSCGAEGFTESLSSGGVRQVVLCGIETHICVNQTAQGLLDAGYEVHLLTDCVGSRFEHDKQAGLAKMFALGALPCSVEMALFEMMKDSKNEHFKEIQALVR